MPLDGLLKSKLILKFHCNESVKSNNPVFVTKYASSEAIFAVSFNWTSLALFMKNKLSVPDQNGFEVKSPSQKFSDIIIFPIVSSTAM